MPTLAHRANTRLVRGLIMGYPGSGKTGSLASLANAGYKLRIIDTDNNLDPLYGYIKPEFYNDVDIVTVEDPLKMGVSKVQPIGKPRAFETAIKLLDRWKYKDPNTAEEVDLGAPKDWDDNTILVVDNLTGLGRAAMRRTLHINNRIEKGPRERDWGLAMADQEALIEMLTSSHLGCHVLCLAHLKLVGPKMEEAADSEETKEAKHEIQQLVPFKLFPNALGRALPPVIGQYFPITVLCEAKTVGGKTKRIISVSVREDIDINVPLKFEEKNLPLETGMQTIFEKVRNG